MALLGASAPKLVFDLGHWLEICALTKGIRLQIWLRLGIQWGGFTWGFGSKTGQGSSGVALLGALAPKMGFDLGLWLRIWALTWGFGSKSGFNWGVGALALIGYPSLLKLYLGL